MQSHKKAATFKNKRLSHFKELCIIFGKDRVMGKYAQSTFDILNDIENGNMDSHQVKLEEP